LAPLAICSSTNSKRWELNLVIHFDLLFWHGNHPPKYWSLLYGITTYLWFEYCNIGITTFQQKHNSSVIGIYPPSWLWLWLLWRPVPPLSIHFCLLENHQQQLTSEQVLLTLVLSWSEKFYETVDCLDYRSVTGHFKLFTDLKISFKK